MVNISTITPMPPIAPITPPHNVQKKRKRHTATLAKASMYFLKAGFAWNSGIFFRKLSLSAGGWTFPVHAKYIPCLLFASRDPAFSRRPVQPALLIVPYQSERFLFLIFLFIFLACARLAQLPQVGYLDGRPDGPAFSEHGIVWFGKAFVYEDYFSFWFLCGFIAHANFLRDKKDPGEVTITS